MWENCLETHLKKPQQDSLCFYMDTSLFLLVVGFLVTST